MHSLLTAPRESLAFEVLEPTVGPAGEIALHYRINSRAGDEQVEFTERITIPGERSASAPPPLPDTLVRLLALAASLSYYKTCIPTTYSVPGGLTQTERTFLEEVIRNGLGEFAFRNDVASALRPTIEAPLLPEVESDVARRGPSPDPVRPLVAVGGGKDSIVTIESLRRMPVEVSLFSVNSYAPIEATAEAAALPLLVARRRIDPLLFELNAAGALNGHVPVTAINSLIGCLTAVRNGHDAVVFSNEASSSFGNVAWEGIEVNHQWSKGLGFERLLSEAITSVPVRYFSFLRPLTELAIMRRFGQLREYHCVFTSCNRAFHLDESKRRLWCGECPKCHFVFLLLAPFVSRDELLAIFRGRDLFADPTQLEGFLELLNVDGRMKPFECVGEPDECRAALTLISVDPDWADHPFLQLPQIRGAFLPEAEVVAAFAPSDDHLLPPSYEKAVREIL
ncbi:hypothetical protein [Nocardioides gilvus]|uniref:hypothetical protein n=1 Tax=Nocardioides gilvus TaxID=1735589 RepID=UPI000D74958C|nr:hypothetical protein [Nocardioides gilvus]